MNIVFSAFACEPGRGSEEGVGWNIPWAMSARHNVHVLTTPRHRQAIESYLDKNPNPRITFSYYDISPRLLGWVRHSSLWQIYYYVWQRKILGWSRDQLARFDPEVVHHISYVRYWTPSSLWRSGRALVWADWRSRGYAPGISQNVFDDLTLEGATAEHRTRDGGTRSEVASHL